MKRGFTYFILNQTQCKSPGEDPDRSLAAASAARRNKNKKLRFPHTEEEKRAARAYRQSLLDDHLEDFMSAGTYTAVEEEVSTKRL